MTEFQDFNSAESAEEETRIRREYKNLGTIKIPYTTPNGHTFIVAKFLEVDERGGDIGTAPVVYKSSMAEDGDNVIVLASHALQTEQGVAYVLRRLRMEFCGGDLDEAVKIVDEAKRALGIDCEEYIALLREVNDPARALMAKQEARTLELAEAARPAKQIEAKQADRHKTKAKDQRKSGGA